MHLLKQIGPTCTETAAAMVLDCSPDFFSSKHIQDLMDIFYDKGYIIMPIDTVPTYIDSGGYAKPLLDHMDCEQRLMYYLEKHRALLYQVPPKGQRHMFAWDPVLRTVDPRTGTQVEFPDYIQTAYVIVRKSHEAIRPS